jgi:hypothetical protein
MGLGQETRTGDRRATGAEDGLSLWHSRQTASAHALRSQDACRDEKLIAYDLLDGEDLRKKPPRRGAWRHC